MTSVAAAFDITPAQKFRLEAKASLIRSYNQHILEGIHSIGKALFEVRAEIPHGSWLGWLRHEFDWTERTARNYIHAFEWLDSNRKPVSDLAIDLKTVYLLSRRSTPRAATEEVRTRLYSGERVTHQQAREAVKRNTVSISSYAPGSGMNIKPARKSPRTPAQVAADREREAREKQRRARFHDLKETLCQLRHHGQPAEDWETGEREPDEPTIVELADMFCDPASWKDPHSSLTREDTIQHLLSNLAFLTELRDLLIQRGIIRRTEVGARKPIALKAKKIS